MNKEFLYKSKDLLNRVYDSNSQYDRKNFSSKDEELEYIKEKTENYSIYDNLLNKVNSDGIIVITENSFYALDKIFVHMDAFKKLFECIEDVKIHDDTDVITRYVNKGNVLIRVVNFNGTLGFDPYIPESINNYQICHLTNMISELNKIYKELERMDSYSTMYIKYAIKTIQEAIQNNKMLIKRI